MIFVVYLLVLPLIYLLHVRTIGGVIHEILTLSQGTWAAILIPSSCDSCKMAESKFFAAGSSESESEESSGDEQPVVAKPAAIMTK